MITDISKNSLAEQIIGSITEAEWERLESGDLTVSQYNRDLLLKLREDGSAFDGSVPSEDVNGLRSALSDYLTETWPEHPEVHKFVIAASLALTFLYELPMHPQEFVHWEKRGNKYFCRAKNETRICRYCVTE